MRKIFILAAFLFCLTSTRAESPSQFTKRFFHSLYKWEIRGAPDAREINQLSPLLGEGLIKIFKKAESQKAREQASIKRKYKNAPHPPVLKSAWSKEGDLFASIAESFDTFAVGIPILKSGTVKVPVHLEHLVSRPPYRWTVVLVLDRSDQDWVVSDIVNQDGESLRTSLTKTIAENEAYLSSLNE